MGVVIFQTYLKGIETGVGARQRAVLQGVAKEHQGSVGLAVTLPHAPAALHTLDTV